MKYIFVTGGVLSGIGKGIAAASIGAILKGMGQQVFCQKFDGYLNVDPGTMSPFQHGEVFVTNDGAETDLDLGHYERFLDINLSKLSSFTSGKLYEEIITRERKGDYLGGTVQIVPHLTDLVKEKIIQAQKSSGADISIVEIGGTIGDMENEYLLESARQMQHDLGRENVIFVHVVLLPYLGASKEFKSKPIQHSVRTMMSYGLSPDFLVVRADTEIADDMVEKIARSCGIVREHVISAPTLDTIYRVPLAFESQNFGYELARELHISPVVPNMEKWTNLVCNIDSSHEVINIAMVGKYVGLEDAYYSLNEGLRAAGFAFQKRVKIEFIEAEDVEKRGISLLYGFDGICIPGGFGTRGVDGMVLTAQYARENNIPFLGICLGSQIMAIEFARNVLGIQDASSEEFTPEGGNNIIHIMSDQKNLTTKGGNMRLGLYPCVIRDDTLAERVYKEQIASGTDNTVFERHRHRFEFNPTYRDKMEEKGFIVSASSPDDMLAEIVEIKNHPYMIATQAHPELISRPFRPHPLFLGFIGAML
ncbi:MAG: CTP synthase [Candidatus Gracilibacteria bacterium]